jgi:Holliday junction resolvase RusA-like endonuclease
MQNSFPEKAPNPRRLALLNFLNGWKGKLSQSSLEFILDGIPVPWATRVGSGKYAYSPRYKEKQYAQWRIREMHRGGPLSCAVRLDFTFYMPIPASTSKKLRAKILQGEVRHIKKPDTTNLQKFHEDILVGIVLLDDNQVVEIHSKKLYAEIPSTHIKVFSLE